MLASPPPTLRRLSVRTRRERRAPAAEITAMENHSRRSSSPTGARRVSILACALVLSLGVRSAHAQQPTEAAYSSVSLEVTPDSLVVSAGVTSPAVVTVTNPGQRTLSDLTLSSFSAQPVSVDVVSEDPVELRPFATYAWNVRIGAEAPGAFRGPIHFRLDYSHSSGSATAKTTGISLAQLTVRGLDNLPADSVADVSVETRLASLSEHRPGPVYLLVRNRRALPLVVGPVRAVAPEFIAFDTALVVDTVPPYETTTLTLTARAEDQVRPGTQLLLFDVPLAWEERGRAFATNVVVTHEVAVSVLGESEILGVLGAVGVGIPSFLLLPGFLILVTVWFLYRLRFLRPSGDGFKLPTESAGLVKEPWFWAMTITLSGLMAVAYPLFPGGRSYLDGYGLRDVWLIWMLSISIGFGGYTLVGLTLATRRAWKRKEAEQQDAAVAARTPATGDDELEMLRKLSRQGLGLVRPRWRLEDHRFVFAVSAQQKDGTIWVAPAIEVSFAGQDHEVEDRLTGLMGADRDPGALATALEEAGEAGAVTVRFAPGAKPLTGPELWTADQLGDGRGQGNIVYRV